MSNLTTVQPVDYLVIGHLTVDLTPSGPALGGSAAYASLTAHALGLKVGIVTAWGREIPLTTLEGISIVSVEAEHSTTFENLYTIDGRVQYIRKIAPRIPFDQVPESWRRAKIIHLAPIAQEVDGNLPESFRPRLLGVTPQGWLRTWDDGGRVRSASWPEAEVILPQTGAAVLSVEDLGYDEEQVERFAHLCPLMAVTDGSGGARLFWHGDSRRFRPPQVDEKDPTGAGDVFAASFFVRLLNTRDPWEAARFANRMAAISVTRTGLMGVPTQSEIQACLMEVLS